MTEANMKKMYEHFLATDQPEKAQEILDIPRYAKFKKTSEEKEPDTKKKKEK